MTSWWYVIIKSSITQIRIQTSKPFKRNRKRAQVSPSNDNWWNSMIGLWIGLLDGIPLPDQSSTILCIVPILYLNQQLHYHYHSHQVPIIIESSSSFVIVIVVRVVIDQKLSNLIKLWNKLYIKSSSGSTTWPLFCVGLQCRMITFTQMAKSRKLVTMATVYWTKWVRPWPATQTVNQLQLQPQPTT